MCLAYSGVLPFRRHHFTDYFIEYVCVHVYVCVCVYTYVYIHIERERETRPLKFLSAINFSVICTQKVLKAIFFTGSNDTHGNV